MAHENNANNDRYARGWDKLKEIDGEAGERVIGGARPNSARLRTLFESNSPFGDIYSRPALDLKAREIATIAALAALGNAQPQLKVHIEGALNVGCSREEIVEVFMAVAVYAGFPAALNALFATRVRYSRRVMAAATASAEAVAAVAP